MFELAEKQALVTGAGSGIGRAIAELFARQGARVWIVDRDETAGRVATDAIISAGGQAEFFALDVSDPSAVGELADRLPPLDILVNNAGIGHVGELARDLRRRP